MRSPVLPDGEARCRFSFGVSRSARRRRRGRTWEGVFGNSRSQQLAAGSSDGARAVDFGIRRSQAPLNLLSMGSALTLLAAFLAHARAAPRPAVSIGSCRCLPDSSEPAPPDRNRWPREHEIKQPLAAIVTAGSAGLRWLSKPTPELEEVRALLKLVVSEGNRASQVIDGIRGMFKNENREKVLLDVSEMTSEVIALMHSKLQKHQISVQAELISELPPVLADRIQLQQVVANLIANAIEAMATVTDRARTLRVKSAIREPDGVSIAVEDSGPGIDPENADRIFHPFFTTKSEGTGMGLSICRSTIEAHNGRLSLRPAFNRGSVFEILLPAGDLEAINTRPSPFH
jgi:signal transduction histidine kinase